MNQICPALLLSLVCFASGLRLQSGDDPALDKVDTDSVTYENAFNGNQFSLNGEPRSGTEWLEHLIDDVLEDMCESREYCHYHKTGASSHHETRASGLPTEGEGVQWDAKGKHAIPGVDPGRKGLAFGKPKELSKEELSSKIEKLLATTNATQRWVLIARDPRDVILSSCHYEHKTESSYDCDKYARQDDRGLRNVEWINLRFQSFKEIMRQSNGDKAVIIHFENLKHDLRGELSKVVEFMGLSSSEINWEPLEHMGLVGLGGKTKRGKTCGFQQELKSDTKELIYNHMLEVMDPELMDVFSRCPN